MEDLTGGSIRGGTDARVMGGGEVVVGTGRSMFVGCSAEAAMGVGMAMGRVVAAGEAWTGVGRCMARVEGGPDDNPTGVATTTGWARTVLPFVGAWNRKGKGRTLQPGP